ncbi:PE-PGRS family protein PE_PGRS26 [Mycobacterium innocens]|uniref:PE-PGRS family protein PE_PGRS26 n=1 Tax=Mycobacterium innocens TaxID=2341083 RepID=A0A498QF27_9MYCO|nr:PE family protein [Mycobacterium innocens]VBA44007.1 PE-PGRS family protein PE_PGRS26 [Mycobacterium innocens]
MSSSVIAAPEAIAVASGDLTGIGEAIKGAAAAAAPSTTGIIAAAGDEVSAAIAGLFGGYAREFQALSAQTTTLFHAEFVRALSAAGAAYAAAEAANTSPLRMLLQQAENSGIFAPIERLLGRPLFGNGAAGSTGATGAVGATAPSTLLNTATNEAGLSGAVNYAATQALAAPATNGVTGVKSGFSFLQIPIGPSSFLGFTIPQFNYPAPAQWYFPTQADGSVNATGVIYLQHGFGAIGWFYEPLAVQLAQQTNSVVVVPTVPSIPLPFGLWIGSPQMQQGVASLFLGPEAALNISANQAGYQGTLPQDFILSGHSAGGGLATIAAGDYLADLGANTNHLRGVVMFDGVASNATAFGAAVANLQSASVPVYVVAAPPQPWNAFGGTTNQLVSLYPGQFVGVEIVNGSHVDSMLGGNPLVDFAAQLLTGFSPPGATAAVYTLSSGWVNDIYAGAGPLSPMYGVYGPTGGYVAPGGQAIFLGQASGIVLPA